MNQEERTVLNLLAEIEDLRARLQEAEDTISGIKSGKVDALVVSGDAGEELYMLRGAERPYRILVESMNEGALSLTAEGAIIYANNAFVRMSGAQESSTSLALCFRNLVYDPDLEKYDRFWADIMETGEIVELRLVFDGQPVPVYLSGSTQLIDNEPVVFLVITDISERKKSGDELKQSLAKSKRIISETVSAIATMAESRDSYTAGHQRRVAQLACAIAEEMGFTKARLEGISIAGTIHDIGKVAVPAEILTKSGKLSEIEFNMVKTHTEVGYNILRNIEFPWPVAEMAFQHHERMNGSGYPSGLTGEEILLEARILAVADVVEAMASHRPYRPAQGTKEALDEISSNKGKLYDSEVVDCCTRLFNEKGFRFVEPEEKAE